MSDLNKYLNIINNSLTRIDFDNYAENDLSIPANPKINEQFYLELVILCHGYDIFLMGDIDPKQDVHKQHPHNNIYSGLTHLHFIYTIKTMVNTDDDDFAEYRKYKVCKLTPLGLDFVKNATDIYHESRKLFHAWNRSVDPLRKILKHPENISTEYDLLCDVTSWSVFEAMETLDMPTITCNTLVTFLLNHNFNKNLAYKKAPDVIPSTELLLDGFVFNPDANA